MIKLIRRILVPAATTAESTNTQENYFKRKGDAMHVWLILLLVIYCLLYSIIDCFLDSPIEALIIFCTIPFLLFYYYFLFRKGHTVTSKVMYILTALFLVAILFYINGTQTGLVVFFIPIFVATQITFLGKERKIAFVLYGVIFLAIVVFLATFTYLSQDFSISNAEVKVERILNLVFALFATVYEVGFLLITSKELEIKLIESQTAIDKKNGELSVSLSINEKKRKKIEEQVRQIEKSELQLQKLSTVITNTKNGAVITDSHGRIEWVNKAYETMTGYLLNEIIGKKPSEFLLKNGQPNSASRFISEKLKNKERVEATVENYKKNGDLFYNELEITPVFNADGELISFFSIQRDVTANIKAQEELLAEKTKQQQLMATVAIQMQEIENSRVATILHEDINQMLAVAKMHIEMSGSNDAAQQKSAAIIQDALQGIRKLSHSLSVPFGTDYEMEDAISDLLAEYPEFSHIKVNFVNELENEFDIKEDIRIGAYRIVQEAIKNIFARNDSNLVLIKILNKETGLLLRINDNSIGCKHDFNNIGDGVKMIYNRVMSHSGTMKIESEIGKGCELEIFIPAAVKN